MRNKILTLVLFIICSYCVARGIRLILSKVNYKGEKMNIVYENLIQEEIVEELEVEKYNYELISTVKLLHTKTGIVEEIPLDEYIVNVVAAEMPVDYELEALKAQAIVARTYTMYKITCDKKHENADICDDFNCCQAWISKEDRFNKWDDRKQENWNKLVQAVNETKGKYILYDNKVINAFFHSNSSGKTEKPEDVWGGSLPYLTTVETSGEENYSSYKSEVSFTKDEFEKILNEKYSTFKINFEDVNEISVLEYTDSGRVRKIKIGNMEFSGVEIRKMFSLKSTNFIVKILDDKIIFSVLGYGHGVGLSQTGSDALAKQGYTADEIIKHFYKNIEIHE